MDAAAAEQGSEAPTAPADTPVVTTDETPAEQNTEHIQAALLNSVETFSAEQALHPQADGTDEHASKIQLDKTALRSLQQFIEGHGLTAQSVQSPEDSYSTISDPSSPIVKTGEPTLPESIAQHYIPNRRQEIKILTDDERVARRERIKQENRERKKKWREQNHDRNRDNDLRCRVHKRANRMFGIHNSELKRAFIEEEFRKRQLKRRRDAGPKDSSQGDDPYAAFLSNPEFAEAFSGLVADKGLGEFKNDIPMLLDSLKQLLSPENFKSVFQVEGQEEQVAAQEDVPPNSIPTALPEALTEHHVEMTDVEYTSAPKLDVLAVPLMSIHPELRHLQLLPMIRSIPTATAPIPRLNSGVEKSTRPRKVATTPPAPPPAPPPPLIPIPAPVAEPVAPIQTVANPMQPRPPPPQDRIRAFGFPPMMQSR